MIALREHSGNVLVGSEQHLSLKDAYPNVGVEGREAAWCCPPDLQIALRRSCF